MKTTLKKYSQLKLLIAIVFCTIATVNAQSKKKSSIKDGYVPNKETAIKIAEAIWLPIYGEKIYQEKPFKAVLVRDSVWIVTGTLKDPGDDKDIVGGTAYIEIQKSDCKILKVIHGK